MDQWNKVLDRNFDIKPLVPRWLSEEFEKIMKGKCGKVNKLLENDQWEAIDPATAKQILSMLKKGTIANENPLNERTRQELKNVIDKLLSIR